MQQFLNYITIDVAAFLVALMACIFTIWQLIIQRKHNKLSVKPLLQVKHNWESKIRSICIKNCGLGPVIITDITLVYKAKKIHFDTISDKYDLANEYLDLGFYSYGETVDKDSILDKGEELQLLSLSFHEDHDYNNARERIFTFLKETKLVISYKSIYNEPFNLSVSLYSNIDQRYA